MTSGKVASVRVLTVREVAEILKLHPRTVAKMARSGEIPATRIGRVWRFDEAVVLEWFKTRLEGGTTGKGTATAAGDSWTWNGTTRVADFLRKETVQYTAERKSKQEVLESLAALAMRTRRVPNYEQLFQSLVEREEMCPTALEGGIAFPHPRHPLDHLRQPVLALLVTRYGVEFGASDEKATRAFVLVCSPDDSAHVRILSHLARLFRPTNAVARLTRCHTPAKIVREVQRLEDLLISKAQSRREEVTECSSRPLD